MREEGLRKEGELCAICKERERLGLKERARFTRARLREDVEDEGRSCTLLVILDALRTAVQLVGEIARGALDNGGRDARAIALGLAEPEEGISCQPGSGLRRIFP